jgi:cyclophilin family peptidyl-prolyl cis-trans isomerase
VNSFSRKFWNLFSSSQRTKSRRPKKAARSKWQPTIEWLEDRTTPSSAGFTSTAPGVVSGFVYVNPTGSGALQASDPVLPGITVDLTGTTSQGGAVNVSTTTDTNGQFIFYQVSPGTYTLSRGSTSSFFGDQGNTGNLGGTAGADAISTISMAQGQVAINYDFSVKGLVSSAVSFRDFLASSTIESATADFFSAGGAGSTAADGSVQPTGAAVGGSASLSGSVVNGSNGGIQGVQVALSGIDMSGRDLFETTTTNAAGAYQFSDLAEGTYNLNVVSPPTGFRDGDTAVGSAGGQAFLNGQVADIQLGASASGTGYNFTELGVPTLSPSAGLAVTASLADDTAGPGGTTSDGITSDPSIQGQIVSSSALTSVEAGLDSSPASEFMSILSNIATGGAFFLNPALMAMVAGGSLAQGSHTLHLVATNAQGQTSSFSVQFILQSTPPATPTLHMDTTSDPKQNGTTTSSTVTLLGQTSAGVNVALMQNGSVISETTSNASTGAFEFDNVSMPAGSNDFTVQATDIAGNVSQLQTFFVHETGPVAVPTAPVVENLSTGSAATFVDLSSKSFFTDADESDTIVRLNTNDGPIDLELFDAQDPATVTNFLDYIEQGDFNNDIFQRLAEGFVLQGGGFTFNPTTNTITTLTAGPSIVSEFNSADPTANGPGTIAMALTGTDVNSGTDEFFFNLADNSASLDPQSFTVFGQVLSGADMRVIDTLANATVVDESSFNSAFNTFPLNNYNGNNFPSDASTSNFDIITSATIVQQTEQLTYSIASDTDTSGAIVTASIDKFGQLELIPVSQGVATIVVKATDLDGESAEVTFTVNVGPVAVVNPGAQTNLDGDSVDLAIKATDTNDKTLTYSATGLPTGLSIDTSTGVITGPISATANNNSPYNVTVTATDGTSTASQSFTWTVSNPITFAANPGTQSNDIGDTVSIADAAADAKTGTVTYSDGGTLPPGLAIGTDGTISGTITSAASTSTPYDVTITATDGTYTATQNFTWNVSADAITFNNNPASVEIADNDVVSLSDAVTDNTGGTPTYTAIGLPASLSIDPNSGIISGTVPATADQGNPYNVTVTAKDGIHSATQTFTWNVNAISFTSNPGPQTNAEQDMVNLADPAVDAEGGTLQYTDNGTLPPGLSIGTANGTITGTVNVGDSSNGNGGVYNVTITATDGTFTATQQFTWTITA